MFKKIDGYYWVKQNNNSKIGFANVFSAIDYKYPALYPIVAIGVLPIVITIVIVLLSK